MNCPICGVEVYSVDNEKVTDEELIHRFTPYYFICWYCTTFFSVYHDGKIPFVKEIEKVGNPKDREKFTGI